MSAAKRLRPVATGRSLDLLSNQDGCLKIKNTAPVRDRQAARRKALAAIVEGINRRFGAGAVRWAVSDLGQGR